MRSKHKAYICSIAVCPTENAALEGSPYGTWPKGDLHNLNQGKAYSALAPAWWNKPQLRLGTGELFQFLRACKSCSARPLSEATDVHFDHNFKSIL